MLASQSYPPPPAALKATYMAVMFGTVPDVTLKLPDVGGHVLQRVEREAEPGVIMAHRTLFGFKQDLPLHRMDAFGARQTRRHSDNEAQISMDQTPDLKKWHRRKHSQITQVKTPAKISACLSQEVTSGSGSDRLATDSKQASDCFSLLPEHRSSCRSALWCQNRVPSCSQEM